MKRLQDPSWINTYKQAYYLFHSFEQKPFVIVPAQVKSLRLYLNSWGVCSDPVIMVCMVLGTETTAFIIT